MEKALVFFSFLINLILFYKYKEYLFNFFFQKNKNLIKLILRFFYRRSGQENCIYNPVVAYIASDTIVNYISEDIKNLGYKKLPNSLVIDPGYYRFNELSYQLTQEGLFRLIQPEKRSIQRIIYKKNVAILMSSIAWIVSHGDDDDHLSYEGLIKKSKYSKLILTCESISRFAFSLLDELNIQCRIIGTRTLEQWNSYDCGHYFIEIYREDLEKWVLYDLDHDSYFSYKEIPLSLIEFIDHLSENYQINLISSDFKVSIPNCSNNYDPTFIQEGRINQLKQWYNRIMQFIFIEDRKENFSFSIIIPEVIHKLPRGAFPKMNYLSEDEFIEKFYAHKETRVNIA